MYDADHARIKEVSGNGTIHFVNPGGVPLFERHSNYNATGVTRYRHFVPGPGGASVLYTQYSNQAATTIYLHKDQLGSTTAASTSAGGCTIVSPTTRLAACVTWMARVRANRRHHGRGKTGSDLAHAFDFAAGEKRIDGGCVRGDTDETQNNPYKKFRPSEVRRHRIPVEK